MARNKEIESAINQAQNTAERDILKGAIDNTQLYNQLAAIGAAVPEQAKYTSKAERRDSKARLNQIAKSEIEALKRDFGAESTEDAIGIANTNRLNNANYFNVLLENSDYAKEELNQGNQQIANAFVDMYRDLDKGVVKPSALNSGQLGIMRGGFKFQENPQEPIRMAGDELNRFVGAGSFADVFKDPDIPNVVQKIQPEVADVRGQLFPNKAKDEVEYQLIAAEKGIGPKVDYFEQRPDGTTVIGMQDVSKNYRSFAEAEKELTPQQLASALIKHNLQLGELGQAGIRMADRHKDNVQLHKMVNRPLQIDFGPVAEAPSGNLGFQGTQRINNENGLQAYEVGQRASKAMIAAGLEDEGKLLNDSIMNELNEGRFDSALDVATQGFNLAKKLTGKVDTTNVLSPAAFVEPDGSLSRATSDNLLGTEGIYSRFAGMPKEYQPSSTLRESAFA